jgi:hypothetical protein
MGNRKASLEVASGVNAASATDNPYLSIVLPSRNDDHGGNLKQRMQLSVNGLLEQLEKYRIESELILIDWNPPADRIPLKDMLSWPQELKYCTIRCLLVPPAIHKRFQDSDKTPFAIDSMNSGIRRARGQFILPRASDVIYSNELVSYIAEKKLQTDRRYRVDRHDVDKNVVQYDSLDEQLEYCRNHTILIKSQPVKKKSRIPWLRDKLPDLHTSACGDFQLMSRYYWHLLHGYRDGDIISAYADSLLSFASYAAGVGEVVLKYPLCIYHIDHGEKFTDKPQSSGLPLADKLSFSFLPKQWRDIIFRIYRIILTGLGYRLKGNINGIRTLHFSEYRRIAAEMVSGHRSYILNDENWGLRDDELEEFIINRAYWDDANAKN